MIYVYLADIGLTRKNDFIKSDRFELSHKLIPAKSTIIQ